MTNPTSVKSIEVSSFSFHSLLSLLLAAFNWNTRTDGVFHVELNVRASAVDSGRTEKSLKRCHWLSLGAVGSAWATKISTVSTQQQRISLACGMPPLCSSFRG